MTQIFLSLNAEEKKRTESFEKKKHICSCPDPEMTRELRQTSAVRTKNEQEKEQKSGAEVGRRVDHEQKSLKK